MNFLSDIHFGANINIQSKFKNNILEKLKNKNINIIEDTTNPNHEDRLFLYRIEEK